MTPFRNEKNSNWEGAFPGTDDGALARQDQAGTVRTRSSPTRTGWPTLLAAAGETDIGEKLKKGHSAGDKKFKGAPGRVQFPALLHGKEEKGPRPGFIYFSDDGDLVRLRYRQLEIRLREQRCQGTVMIWANPSPTCASPKNIQPAPDPFERADITSTPIGTG